ncbi:MAG: hypothetical protein JO345_18140 [Streptosporangiaceae bacterium]|nr:hypothetical protein [Streptosporangiaceae bacterium]
MRIPIDPGHLTCFSGAGRPFFLFTTADYVPCLDVAPAARTLLLDPARSLAANLRDTTPDDGDVLVIAPGLFLASPAEGDDLGGRRVCVMPCGSTPVTAGQVAHGVVALRSADPEAQQARAEAFFAAIENASALTLTDRPRRTACGFDATGDHLSWHQQAGPLAPGEQQIGPAGELAVFPGEITSFTPDRTLPLDGELCLRGWPIVHGGYRDDLADEQAALYQALLPLHAEPVRLTIEDGRITGCAPLTPGARQPAAALTALFQDDPRLRVIWELGFGINPDVTLQPGNCGLNEVYGGRHGVVHLGLGLTPWTRFALTFLCPDTTLVADDARAILGPPPLAGRVNRRKSASCGCT